MRKVYKTDIPKVYIILEDRKNKTTVTKCTGYFMKKVFLGAKLLDRKVVTGEEKQTIVDMLNDFFTVVDSRDTMGTIQDRISQGGL